MGYYKNELPNGWDIASFGLLFDNVTSSKLKLPQKQYGETGEYPVVDQGIDLIGGYTDKSELLHPDKPPLIIFGDHTRCIKLINFKFVQGADGVKVLSPSKQIDPIYSYYLLKTADLPDKGYSRHFKYLKECVFRVAPLNEQKRIVAKIEELQACSRKAREALETVPDLLEQLRQSILTAAFRGDLTRQSREQNPEAEPASELLKRIRIEGRKRWEAAEMDKLKAKGLTGDKLDAQFAKRRKQYKEPESVDSTDLPELPEGWYWATLSCLSWNASYGTSAKCDYVGGGNPVIRIPNVLSGRLETDDLKYSLNRIELSLKEFLATNDLLVVRTNGSLNLLGRCAVVEKDFDTPTYFASYLIRYRLCGGLNLARWIAYLWESLNIRKRIESLASTSAGQYNMNLAKLGSILLPIPPDQEIDKAVILLQSLFQWLQFAKKNFEEIDEQVNKLDQSILNQAFQGTLVPQDPKDEPASILLERIRQEKARLAADKKNKPTQRGKKMKGREIKQKDILTILQETARTMTPEELFAAGGFGEDSVDAFYEHLRAAVVAKKVREIRKGAEVRLEAAP